MARVQIRDLDPPEQLRPSGIQRDTFAAAAPPPIDNNLEKLSSALGSFASSVGEFHRASVVAERRDKLKRDKEALDYMDGEWNKYLAATHSDQIMADIKAGRAPFQRDPLFKHVVEAYQGKRYAVEVGQIVNRALAEDPSITMQPGFNAERFVLEKSAEFLRDNPIASSRAAQKAFQEVLAGVKNGTIEHYQKLQALRNQREAATIAVERFTEKFNAAVDGGFDVASTSAYMQSVYKELGPRMRGGSLDFQYEELDKLQLAVLEEMATKGTKKQAEMALALVNTARQDVLDPTGKNKIPPLSTTLTTKAAAEQVARKAIDRIDKFDELEQRQKYIGMAVDSIKRMDGQTVLFGEKIPVQLPSGKAIELNAKEIRQEAFRIAEAQFIKENGRPMTTSEKFELYAKNGEKAPEAGLLNQEAAAALAPLSKDPAQRQAQIDRFVRAAVMYDDAANAAGGVDISSQVEKKSRHVYETWITLTKKLGWTAEAAAQEVLRTYSETTEEEMSKRDLLRIETVRSKIGAIDFNGWSLGGKVGSWFGPRVVNDREVSQEILETAIAISRVKGISEEKAIDQAIENVKKRATFVNGVVIYGTNGYNPSDTPFIEHLMRERFKAYPKSMAAAGVTDPSQLSIQTERSGAATVVDTKSGETIRILPEELGKGVASDPNDRPVAMTYQPREHQALRASFGELMKDYEFRKSVERHKEAMKDYGKPVPELISPIPRTPQNTDGFGFQPGADPRSTGEPLPDKPPRKGAAEDIDKAVRDWVKSTPSARELGNRIREDFKPSKKE